MRPVQKSKSGQLALLAWKIRTVFWIVMARIAIKLKEKTATNWSPFIESCSPLLSRNRERRDSA